MPSISESSITSTGDRGGLPRLLDVVVDELGDAVDERMFEPPVDVPRAPFGGDRFGRLLAGAGEARRRVEQSLGGVGPAGEHDVLAQLAQLGIDLVVHRELTGVDDAEAHAVPRCVRSRNTECIASRTGSLPRNANDRFDTPPEMLTYGSSSVICLVASMKSSP